MPNIISSAKKKITIDPATANELISMPIKFNISSPINKKAIIIQEATIVAFSDSILPTLLLSDIITGTFPIISITANRIIPTVKISLKFISNFCANIDLILGELIIN